MELWEVEQFGIDSFGDPDYVSIYGMEPAEWYARGVRLLARTTLEAVAINWLDNRPGCRTQNCGYSCRRAVRGYRSIRRIMQRALLVLRNVPNASAVGFEMDGGVFERTSRNLAMLDLPIELIRGDYRTLIGERRFPAGHYLVIRLGPPWGDALTAENGRISVGPIRRLSRSSMISTCLSGEPGSFTSSRLVGGWFRRRWKRCGGNSRIVICKSMRCRRRMGGAGCSLAAIAGLVEGKGGIARCRRNRSVRR